MEEKFRQLAVEHIDEELKEQDPNTMLVSGQMINSKRMKVLPGENENDRLYMTQTKIDAERDLNIDQNSVCSEQAQAQAQANYNYLFEPPSDDEAEHEIKV